MLQPQKGALAVTALVILGSLACPSRGIRIAGSKKKGIQSNRSNAKQTWALKRTKKPRAVRNKAHPLSAGVPPASNSRRRRCESIEAVVRIKAKQHGLEPALVMGLIKVESNFQPEVRSRVGARGLMQVMPRTAQKLECAGDLYNAEDNIECGCKVLRKFLDYFNGDPIYGLAAYNAGPARIKTQYTNRTLPYNFSYVEKVLRWRNIYLRFGCW